MDYGKSAFLKAEDLTRRIDALERKNGSEYGISQYSSTTRREVAGQLALTQRLESATDGGIAMILRLRFDSAAAGELIVSLTAQNCVAANDRYLLGAGEQDVFLMAHATVEAGAADVRIVLNGSTALLGYDLMVFGKGMRGAADTVTLTTAGGYACVHTAGCAYLYALDDADAYLEATLCESALLCETADGIWLCFCDRGTAWRRRIGGFPQFVADGASQALCTDDGTVLLVDGSAFLLTAGAKNRIASGSERAVALLPVTKSASAAFLLRTESDKIYYKERAPYVTAAAIRLGGAYDNG